MLGLPESYKRKFVQERVSGSEGLYSSASEYIRDLVRRDYERKWQLLRNELKPGANATESDFKQLKADTIISQAKARRKSSR